MCQVEKPNASLSAERRGTLSYPDIDTFHLSNARDGEQNLEEDVEMKDVETEGEGKRFLRTNGVKKVQNEEYEYDEKCSKKKEKLKDDPSNYPISDGVK